MRFAEILLEAQPTPFWAMLRQVGVTDAVGVLPRGFLDWRETACDLPWDYSSLAAYQEMVEGSGFHLSVIEDNPPMEAIRFGRSGRDEEIEEVCTLIRNMGQLGIGIWCYNWMAGLGWLRTSRTQRGRGGALVSAYDHGLVGTLPEPRCGAIDEAALWTNLAYFLERVVPIAEECGVTLAMHPDDPPISPIRGVGRIMSTVEGFERLIATVPSRANAITLCQGNFTLMSRDVPKVIRAFGGEGRIAFVHFRDVRGTAERFVETFHDDGQTDMLECMRAYEDIGFQGPARTDHTPTLEGDHADVAGYSALGRLHAVGFMAGLREAVIARPQGLAAVEASPE